MKQKPDLYCEGELYMTIDLQTRLDYYFQIRDGDIVTNSFTGSKGADGFELYGVFNRNVFVYKLIPQCDNIKLQCVSLRGECYIECATVRQITRSCYTEKEFEYSEEGISKAKEFFISQYLNNIKTK